jgi:plasmid stabilization system protein ParE
MSVPAQLASQARQELRDELRWIGRDNLAAARDLRNAIEAAARLIGLRPDIGRSRPDLAPPRYRFRSLPAFSHLLVYDVSQTPPRIARVVHTARDLPTALIDLDSCESPRKPSTRIA